MSAFFVIVARGARPVEAAQLAHMERALAHRGGDGRASFLRPDVGLGQLCRFATDTAEACDNLAEYGGLVLAGDVRIDNREDLAEQLSLSRAQLAELSDEALSLRAFARWGEPCAERLLGDYAFSVWHEKTGTLSIIRDHFGMRPVYYALTPSYFVAASQPRALFACDEVDRRLDELRLADYLAQHHADQERSFFRGVTRLPPGSLLTLTRRGLRTHRYFALDPTRHTALPDNRAYTEQFRAVFREAVRARTRVLGKPGIMLSGGLDSSGILGAMREVAPSQQVVGVSARFPGFPNADEGHYLALLRADSRLEAHDERVDLLSPLASAERAFAYLDEPLYGPNSYVYEALTRRAQALSVRTMIDGLDGDSTVDHGWLYPSVLLHQGRLWRAARELRAMRRASGATWGSLVRSRLLGPDLQALSLAYGLYAWGGYRRDQPGLLSPELARRTGWLEHARATMSERLKPTRSFAVLHHRHLAGPALTSFVEHMDHTSQSLGMDHRHPYFDKRLLELCLSLPAEQRLYQGWDRVIQRRAFEGWVPNEIRLRADKSVWVDVLHRQLAGPDSARLAALSSRRGPLAELVDMKVMDRALEELRAGKPGRWVMPLWSAATLALWLEKHVSL